VFFNVLYICCEGVIATVHVQCQHVAFDYFTAVFFLLEKIQYVRALDVRDHIFVLWQIMQIMETGRDQ